MLAGYSPWDLEEWDMIEQLSLHIYVEVNYKWI